MPERLRKPTKQPGTELAVFAAMLRDRHVLIAFSRQPSIADFIARCFEQAGYVAIACWSTLDDLERAVGAHCPAAIVYEVGFPLADEWERFGEARTRSNLAHVPMIIATAAPPDQYRLFGISNPLEIFTRPSKREIEAALRAAFDPRPRVPDAA
jgi:DNA-binding response OmpR family regulator